MKDRKQRFLAEQRLLKEYQELFVAILFIGLVLRFVIITPYKIPTSAMLPNLRAGDYIFGWKLPFGLNLPVIEAPLLKPKIPGRGDVVIVENPKGILSIKRVIGVPGDKISIKDGHVILNSKDSYLKGVSALETGVPEFAFPAQLAREVVDSKEFNVVLEPDLKKSQLKEIEVPEGNVFLLNDNRVFSEDSRSYGVLPIGQLRARVFVIWLSLDWEKPLAGPFPSPRWNRFFKTL